MGEKKKASFGTQEIGLCLASCHRDVPVFPRDKGLRNKFCRGILSFPTFDSKERSAESYPTRTRFSKRSSIVFMGIQLH